MQTVMVIISTITSKATFQQQQPGVSITTTFLFYNNNVLFFCPCAPRDVFAA